MITLFTGLPGSGKTLHLVKVLVGLKDSGRKIYAYNIDGLSDELAEPMEDARRWEELPDGSVVVIDEVQDVWPSGRRGAPDEVRALSLHRHRGFDFYLTTQTPTMISSWLRGLVGEHVHHVCKWGAQSAVTYTWQEAQDDTKSSAKRKLAERSVFRFPKNLFGLYKSASIHTKKRKFPKAMVLGALFCCMAVVTGFLGYRKLSGGMYQEQAAAMGVDGLSGQGKGLSPGSGRPRVMSPAEWLEARRPRFDGMPWSAPIYDNLQPVNVPRLYCVLWERPNGSMRCHCYAEDATRTKQPRDVCEYNARFGSHNPFVPVGGGSRDRRREDEGASGRQDWRASVRGDVRSAGAGAARWSAGVGASEYDPPGYPGG